MTPAEPEQYDELSFGHDPDLIARYLASERAAPELRAIRREGARFDGGSVSHMADFDGDVSARQWRRAASAPAAKAPPQPPTLAFMALGFALALFAFSIWIALR